MIQEDPSGLSCISLISIPEWGTTLCVCVCVCKIGAFAFQLNLSEFQKIVGEEPLPYGDKDIELGEGEEL